MDISERYKIAPQMKVYDKLDPVWTPFTMFFHPPKYSSTVANTDANGFRLTYKNNKIVTDEEEEICIFMGGSSAFGVGSTSDAETIPSILNSKTNDTWFNFGTRAFMSTQEFMLLMFNWQRFKKIKKISLFSGINNLVLFYLSGTYSEKWGTFYFWNMFRKAMDREINYSLKRILIKMLLYPFYTSRINYETLSQKEIMAVLKGEIKPDTTFKNPPYSEKINNHTEEKGKLLYILKRDLKNLKTFSDSSGISLNYVLQPASTWIKKVLSPEEEKLFNILDNVKSSEHHIIKEALSENQYLWYSENLRKICDDLKIPFFDMNAALQSKDIDGKWIFVDRIHLTDLGNKIVSDILIEEGIC